MHNQIEHLFSCLHDVTRGHEFWDSYLSPLSSSQPLPFRVHLAVFVEPYLQFVLDGLKTIESRFSIRRFAPYNQVDIGDVVLLKKSSGPIVGICYVSHVWFYQLDPESWVFIQKNFAQALCAQDPSFWKDREHASYATLMRVRHVLGINPFSYKKRDRRGWVVLSTPTQQLELTV